ncbi:MAG: hypothetical protein JWM85_2077 [Acidimicrobiaceae bacterium]|nr:hypothetical protein [Acidimicrobiaceae bacterium]
MPMWRRIRSNQPPGRCCAEPASALRERPVEPGRAERRVRPFRRQPGEAMPACSLARRWRGSPGPPSGSWATGFRTRALEPSAAMTTLRPNERRPVRRPRARPSCVQAWPGNSRPSQSHQRRRRNWHRPAQIGIPGPDVPLSRRVPPRARSRARPSVRVEGRNPGPLARVRSLHRRGAGAEPPAARSRAPGTRPARRRPRRHRDSRVRAGGRRRARPAPPPLGGARKAPNEDR